MKVKVAGAALNQTPIDWENNISNIREAVSLAERIGATLLCTPELSICGYGCEDLFYTDWLPKLCLSHLEKLQDISSNLTITVGLPVKYENKLYNCTAIISHSKLIGIVAKKHLATTGIYYENRWFTAWPIGQKSAIQFGDSSVPFGDISVNLEGLKLDIEICEDAWRGSERPANTFEKTENRIILNPSASNFSFGKSRIREELIANSSKEFNCAYLYTNLLGNESGRIIYDGEILVGYKGSILKRNSLLSFKNVNVVSCEIDFNESAKPTSEEFSSPDRNEEFQRTLSLALFDYLRKSGAKGYTISLSGGADSATCAVLIHEMIRLGVDELGIQAFCKKLNIEEKQNAEALINALMAVVYQSTENSTDQTLNAAKELANSLNVNLIHWSVQDICDIYTNKVEDSVGRKLNWDRDDLTLQNIQSRSRAPGVWMLANVHSHLLITTANRSEGNVGYSTMDGDTSGCISPLAGVDKQFILQWLLWAENMLGISGLHLVNQNPPSAELRPHEFHQTDEKDLMPYSIILEIEREAILNQLSPKQTFDRLRGRNLTDETKLKNYIKKFYTMLGRSQWKRERTAPSFHLDDFNIDPRSWFRFPILNGNFQSEIEEL